MVASDRPNFPKFIIEHQGYSHSSEFLKLDGSNANINIDIGAVDLTTTGTLSGGTLTDGTATLTGGALTGLTTPLTFGQGGTGLATWTQYLIPYADTTTSMGQIAIGDATQVLTSNGAGAAPTFQAAAGGSVSFGADNQIPYTNTTTDDFDYSAIHTFDGTHLRLKADNSKLYFGAGDDMSLWFDGTNGRTVTGSTNIIMGSATTADALTGGTNNLAIGSAALSAVTDGINHIAIGTSAMRMTTTGTVNVAIGYKALEQNVTGNQNVAIGYTALQYSKGSQNVGIGCYALDNNPMTGGQNTAIGYFSLSEIEGGDRNTGIGNACLGKLVDGNDNFALGSNAFDQKMVSGSRNWGAGSYAGRYTSGSDNVFLGYKSGYGSSTTPYSTGENNVAIGNNTMEYLEDGNYNLVIGYYAGRHITSGLNNVCIGYNAGTALNTGQANVCLGSNAGPKMTTGSNNFALGNGALYANVTGGANVAIGNACMYNMEGAYGVAIGGDALRECTTHANTAVGKDALRYPNLPQHCVAVGNSSMRGSTTTSPSNNVGIGDNAGLVLEGTGNTLIGHNVGAALTAHNGNVAIGHNALASKDGSDICVAIGQYSGQYITGDRNTFVGQYAGRGTTAGASAYQNTIMGIEAGKNITTCANNAIFGTWAGASLTSGGNNIFLGYYAGAKQTTNTQLLIIDNANRADVATEASNAIIYGQMAATPAAQTLIVNAKLNVQGNIQPTADDTYYIGKNDDDTPFAWKGVILKDTTDGKYYKIEVINGVVTATDLTD